MCLDGPNEQLKSQECTSLLPEEEHLPLNLGSAIRHEWHPLGARDDTCTRDGMTMSVSHESVECGIVESDTSIVLISIGHSL